jgi:hypothetical protein
MRMRLLKKMKNASGRLSANERRTLANESRLTNERGLAMIEALPLLVIFVVMLAFGLGLFGVVHTAILNSIGARTYAIETLQNRSDVTLFRDRESIGAFTHYANYGTRLHIIDSEKNMVENVSGQYATDRPIALGKKAPRAETNVLDHNVNIYNIAGRNRREGGGVGVSPAWIMVGYGICINARCGD